MLTTNTDDAADAVKRAERAAYSCDETAFERSRRKVREHGGDAKSSRFSYSTKLTSMFALTALMTALIAATILAIVWESAFQDYTRENMQMLASKTAAQVAARYEVEGGYTANVLNQVSMTSNMYPDVSIQVIDGNDNTIYDDSWGAVRGDSSAGAPLTPRSRDHLASSSIMVGGARVGTVRIWSIGNDTLLTQNDMNFKINSYQALVIAALIAVLLAAIVGVLIAKALVTPIKRVTATAVAVKGGDLAARTGMQGADEIAQLGETFDAMAESIQRDRELEHRLTADVAHELRTPLMGIQATVEAIMDGVFEADEERLAAINAETLRLKRLVEALLNLSRLESGSVPFHETRVDLTELAASLVMSHEALLEAAELTMTFDFDEKVLVDGDADMLRQATANLISNAVRYNEPEGEVRVGVHKKDGMAAISVGDTGIGIAEEDKPQVFSRFWRADAGRNRASGGLGVGLAVVKEIVDYHDGRIEIDSEVGVGTTFTILIPLSNDQVLTNNKGKGKGRSLNKTKTQAKNKASAKNRETSKTKQLGKAGHSMVDEATENGANTTMVSDKEQKSLNGRSLRGHGVALPKTHEKK